jgi:hypothetical protein
VINEAELAQALGLLARYRGHLGEALVGLKLLRPMQMLRLLTRQVRQKVLDTFAWPAGDGAFFRGRTCEREMAPLGLDAFEILKAGADELPDELLLARLRPLLERHAVLVDPPPVPPEVFRLGGFPRAIYDRLRRPEPLGVLLAEWSRQEPVGGEATDPVRMVFLLIECGLVRVQDGASRTS